jgi:hypothetical protein
MAVQADPQNPVVDDEASRIQNALTVVAMRQQMNKNRS